MKKKKKCQKIEYSDIAIGQLVCYIATSLTVINNLSIIIWKAGWASVPKGSKAGSSFLDTRAKPLAVYSFAAGQL